MLGELGERGGTADDEPDRVVDHAEAYQNELSGRMDCFLPKTYKGAKQRALRTRFDPIIRQVGLIGQVNLSGASHLPGSYHGELSFSMGVLPGASGYCHVAHTNCASVSGGKTPTSRRRKKPAVRQ